MRVSLSFAVLLACCFPCPEASAQHGHGNGGWNNGGGFRWIKPFSQIFNPNHQYSGRTYPHSHPVREPHTHYESHTGHAPHSYNYTESPGYNEPHSYNEPAGTRSILKRSPGRGSSDAAYRRHQQRIHEQRKLEHRQRIAVHLREISDRNGNPQLREAADRLDQRAHEHHVRRLQRIDDAFHAHDGAFGEAGEGREHGLTEHEIALDRQIRNEERKLAHRMEAAQRLRKSAQRTDDARMFEMADHLEETAMSHYDLRLERLSHFPDYFERSQSHDVVTPVPNSSFP